MLRTCAKELNPTWICCFINVCRLPIFIVDSLTVKPNKNRLFQYFLFTTFQQKCQETRSHTRYPFHNTLQCSGTCFSKIPQLLRPISGATMGPLQMSDHKVQKSPNWRANDTLEAVQIGKKIQFGGFVYHVPVRHLLASKAVLHHEVGQLQRAHSLYIFAVSRFKAIKPHNSLGFSHIKNMSSSKQVDCK